MSRRFLFWILLSAAVLGLIAWLPAGLGDWRSEILREWPDRGHPRIVMALAVAPDGRRVASVDAGGGVRVWSADGEALRALELSPEISELAWDPSDGALLMKRTNGEIFQWPDGESEPKLATSLGDDWPAVESPDPLPGIASRGSYRPAARLSASSPDGGTVAFTGDNGTVHLALAGEASPRLLGAPALALAVSESGRWVAVAEGAGILGLGRVVIYDRDSGEQRAALFLPNGPGRCLRFAGENLQILQGRGASGDLRNSEWDWRAGAESSRPLDQPFPCPGGEEERFTVRSLGQVHGPEAALEDRRHELLVELLPQVSRAREVHRRGLLDRLLGRFEWCGLRQDGAIVSVRSRPAQPLPAILLGALLAVQLVSFLAAKLSRR